MREPMGFHFWKNAVHVWLPSFEFKSRQKSKEACLLPHARWPMVFLCGEAYSTVQGWGEGALETAELVFSVINQVRSLRLKPAAQGIAHLAGLRLRFETSTPRDLMVLNGRMLRVSRWKHVHPGGASAIANHKGEDVSDLFSAMMHPDYAYGFLFALQVGWLIS